MTTLALDSADGACSVALWHGGRVVFHEGSTARDNLTWLQTTVARALDSQGLSGADVRRVAVTRGPGGFTGVRVAVGLAQGLAQAWAVPVVPVSTLAVLARAAGSLDGATTAHVAVALDARMGQVYAATYDVSGPLPQLCGDERVCVPQDWQPAATTFIGAGRGFQAAPDLQQLPGLVRWIEDAVVNAAAVVELAVAGWPEIDPLDLEPVYLRDSVASPPRERA